MFTKPLFNRTVLTRSGIRSYSSCNYSYMMSPFSASMMTVGFCFLIGANIRNDISSAIGHLYRQQEEIKKMLKELK